MKYFSEFSAIKKENDIFKLLSIILGGAIFILSFLLIHKETTTIITPPDIKREFEVSGETLNKSYFEQVGFYLADRLLSVSPESVDDSFNSIMSFFITDPDAIKTLLEHMTKEARSIKENDIYQVFYPAKVVINHKSSVFTVEGSLKRLTGNTYLSTEKKSIDFRFKVQRGRLIILGVEVR